MMKTLLVTLVRLLPVMALFSCAAPKAIVVELPAQPKKEVAAVEPVVSEPEAPSRPDDGIRLPDMMTMPKDEDFRTTGSGRPLPTSESGAVIARPPMEPPSRPKASDGE